MGAEELEAALNKATPGAGKRRMDFARRAKHAVFFLASDEAESLGHDYVGADHVLLALLLEPQSLAARALGWCDITYDGARAEVDRIARDRSGRPESNDEKSRVAEIAQKEAEALKQERVGTGAVLLGLLREDDGAAVAVLRGLGAEVGQLRERVLAEIAAGNDDYDRFSAAAREVVGLAEDEARRLPNDYVGTEHLLLAVLRDERSVASEALAARGVTAAALVRALEEWVTGTGEVGVGPLALTERSKRALALAELEARGSLSQVEPEHVLLGLAAESEGPAARVLRELAGHPDELRIAVLRALCAGGRRGGFGVFERFTEAAAEIVVAAQQEARGLEHDRIGSEHILLALLRDCQSSAHGAPPDLGIALDEARQQVARRGGAANGPGPALLPFDSSATAVFERAELDAGWLENDRIDTGHLLLAAVRQEQGVVAGLLDAHGASRGKLRAHALAALGAEWAIELSPAQEQLSRQEQFLREAEARHKEATTDKDRRRQAIYVELTQRGVDRARADVLPESCQRALETLAEYATEEWLKRQPPSEDPDHRRWYRRHCATNIYAQLVHVLFHPVLGPESDPISGHPGGPDAPGGRGGTVPFTLGP